MDDTQKAIIRQRLVDRLDATRAELEEAAELLRSKGKDDWDIDEPMIGGVQWEMVIARQEILKARIDELEDALDRLDEGEYGICQQCGRIISPERLDTMPEATRCVECESEIKEAV